MTKLTEAQLSILKSVRTWSEYGTYMPFANQMQSINACVRRGLLEYRSVDQGAFRNGYALTEAGRAILGEGEDR